MTKKNQMKQNRQKKAAVSQPPKRVSRRDLRRRRIIKRILGLVALFAVIGVGFYFAMKMLFVVRTIEVTGSELFVPKEITDFIAIPEEENIFKVNSEEISAKLTEEFTYLESAQVVKRLPDRLEIKLTDSTESYYTVDENEYRVYSQSFKYLRNGTEPPDSAVWLDADITAEADMEKVKQLIAIFEKYDMDVITKVSVQGENVVSAVYADRFDIDFGTMLDIEYKVKMCKKVLDEKISLEEKGTIDATKGGEIVYKRQ